jgi:MFS family permease
MSHSKLLGYGIGVLALADIVLAASSNWGMLLIGVGLWGIHMGMTQGLLATMVADIAPVNLRGTAYSFFNLASGIAMLVASGLAGFLWEKFGASFTFCGGILFCAISLGALWYRPARQ